MQGEKNVGGKGREGSFHLKQYLMGFIGSADDIIFRTATRLVKGECRGRKSCCRDVNNENWDKWASIFSLSIASSTLQTTDVRLMDLNRFGPAVLGASASGVTMAWRQSSGILEVWRET